MPLVVGVVNGSTRSERTLRQKGGLLIPSKRFSDTYIVLADDLTQSEVEVEAAVGIPPILFPQAGCLCRGYSTKEETRIAAHPNTGVPCALWHVEALFDNDFDPTDRDPNSPPESRRPVVKWDGELESEVVHKDARTGEPIQTANREPILLEDEIVVAILSVERYERYPFDPDVIINYTNHTNSQPFYGAPRGCALMMPISSVEESIEGKLYCKTTYKIKFKIKKTTSGAMEEDTWTQQSLHRGYYYVPDDVQESIDLFGEAGGVDPNNLWKYARIFLDDTGNPKQVNLDERGFRIGGKVTPAGPGQFLTFHTKHEIDFNQLTLGPY